MKTIGLMEVKQALRDPRFRDRLPLELKEDIVKYLSNPGCACNVPLYRKLLREHASYLMEYYPDRELRSEEDQIKQLAQNNWSVINCSVGELDDRLKSLPPGRKQLAIARFEDQVTVIVNELDYLF